MLDGTLEKTRLILLNRRDTLVAGRGSEGTSGVHHARAV